MRPREEGQERAVAREGVCAQADGSLESMQGSETGLKSLTCGGQEVLSGWLEKREVTMAGLVHCIIVDDTENGASSYQEHRVRGCGLNHSMKSLGELSGRIY